MDWPNHFILVGRTKVRPSYDSLTMPQWVAGCFRSVQFQKNPEYREHMLEYFGNLMEDAADFSFTNAKACHAAILANMEQDRLEWDQTDQLDRNRCHYAQRHEVVEPLDEKPVKNYDSENRRSERSVPCKYFHTSVCKIYTHTCAKCEGPHPTKRCTDKKSKNY